MRGRLARLATFPGVAVFLIGGATAATCSAACSDGRILPLGGREPLPYRFGRPELVANLALAVTPKQDNPTLTADLLELYFTAGEMDVDTDVYFARRARREEPFEPPEPVEAVNSPSLETSSAVSPDGLTLWFGSNRGRQFGDHEIWVSTRSSRSARWSAPEPVRELNSMGLDIPRPPGHGGLAMPLSSDRDTPGYYQTFMATRSDDSADFDPPHLLDELSFARTVTADAFLTGDGLTLFFSSNVPPQLPDLFMAWRKSPDDPFEHFEPLHDLNTAGDERDPWLSPDGSELYFASSRDGALAIYVARVERGD